MRFKVDTRRVPVSPVTQATIVDSMQLPPGLDVTPDDPEYEQVVNMWMAVSRNNTMDEVRLKPVGPLSPNCAYT